MQIRCSIRNSDGALNEKIFHWHSSVLYATRKTYSQNRNCVKRILTVKQLDNKVRRKAFKLYHRKNNSEIDMDFPLRMNIVQIHLIRILPSLICRTYAEGIVRHSSQFCNYTLLVTTFATERRLLHPAFVTLEEIIS